MDKTINHSQQINMKCNLSKSNKGKPMNFQEQINQTLKKLSDREREIPEYGDFSPVSEYFENLDKETQSTVGKYGIKIYKMPKDIEEDPKKRFIEAAAYDPSGRYKADFIVGSGSKEEILKTLKDPEFAIELNKSYGQLLEALSSD